MAPLPDPHDREGALLYPVPNDLVPATAVRGTIIAIDQRWLHGAGHFEAYARALGAASPVLHPSTSAWIPFDVALAHWRALDALAVPAAEALRAGRFVGPQVHGAFLRTLVSLAGKVGFTPWAALASSHKLWRRSWQGGGVIVRRLGSSAAKVELVHTAVAGSRFFRQSLMGTIASGLEPFCRTVSVVQRDEERSPTSVATRVAWTDR